MCDNVCHIDKMYPHPLVETAHGQVWYYCEQADLQSEGPSTWDVSQVCIWSDVSSGQHHIRCTPQQKKSSGHGKMIDPHGQLLYHERPFTWEDNYLVKYVVSLLSVLRCWGTQSYSGEPRLSCISHFHHNSPDTAYDEWVTQHYQYVARSSKRA